MQRKHAKRVSQLNLEKVIPTKLPAAPHAQVHYQPGPYSKSSRGCMERQGQKVCASLHLSL